MVVNKKMLSKGKQRGATMIEYAIMVALIAAVAITVVKTLGVDVAAKFTTVDNAITGTPTP